MKINIFVLILLFFQWNCSTLPEKTPLPTPPPAPEPVVEVAKDSVAPLMVGAERMGEYLLLLKDKTVGLVVNHTSMVGEMHLVDTLLRQGVNIKTIFAPEHGFRGTAADGEVIRDGKDIQTGVQITSLYGDHKKPTAADLAGLDWVIFDIQDVGTRFYTYISTMHYVMEACAENKVAFLVLDRPNPNGHYVDGPMRQPGYESFVGLDPIPVVHGMTVGEYARMINEEGWLENQARCDLAVIDCENYTHETPYDLPVNPSPNLPNMRSIYLYPSLCFFEGTTASVGRGTDTQFQVYGHPDYPEGEYTFTPQPMSSSKYPPQEGKLCRGYSLLDLEPDSIRQEARINLSYVIEFYRNFPNKNEFFRKDGYFDTLAGTDQLRKQIVAGLSEEEIRASWREELEAFKVIREKYLLYP